MNIKVIHQLDFKVTMTCQNGNERTLTKTVYSEPFEITENGEKRFIPEDIRIARAIEALKECGYYHIELKKHQVARMIFA